MNMNRTETHRKYLDFLRFWLKDKEYIALAYMTGILPIKKYGLSAFCTEYVHGIFHTDPEILQSFLGFTEEEVRGLCDEYNMSFEINRAPRSRYSSDELGAQIFTKI